MAPVEAITVAAPAAAVVVEEAEKPSMVPQTSMMCNKDVEVEKVDTQVTLPSAVEDGADAAPKELAPEPEAITVPVEPSSVKKARFTKCFPSLSFKKKAQSKPIMVKQKTAEMVQPSEDAEKTEDTQGSTLLDAGSAETPTEAAPQPEAEGPSVPAPTGSEAVSVPEFAGTSTQPTPTPEAEGADMSTAPAPAVKKSCFSKCLSMCSRKKSQQSVIVQQTTQIDASEDQEKAALGTDGEQAPTAEGVDSGIETVPMPTPEAGSTTVALPMEAAPAKKSRFMNCFSMGRSSKKGAQPLKPSSIVPVTDETALDIEQGTTAVSLGSEEKPFVIENVPTVSGTPIDVIATVDATGGTVDPEVAAVAVAAA